MRPLFVFVSVVVMTLLSSCGEDDDPVPESTASPTPTPQVATATPPAATSPPWPTPPADLEQRINACVEGSESAQAVESALKSCPSLQEIGSRATVAEGDVPIVLLDAGPICVYTESFVLWQDGSGWQIRSLESLLDDGGYAGTTVAVAWPYRADGSMAAGPTARVISDGALVRLGVIYGQSGCGSGPHASYMLLSLEDGEWALKWDAEPTLFGGLGHTSVEFADDGIEQLKVKGSSWFRPDNVFPESNAGPHRIFDQVWNRVGDEYVLAEERVRPSAYNTLVEFFRDLDAGDEVGASAWAADASIVQTAQQFGLANRAPDERRWGYCTGPLETGPCVVQKPEFAWYHFDMTEIDGDWLISAVRPCTIPYSGAECV